MRNPNGAVQQIFFGFHPLPIPRVAEHHFANGAVAVFFHAGLIFCNGRFDFTGLFLILCRLGGTAGTVSPPLGQMNQNADGLFLRQQAIQRFSTELIRGHSKAAGSVQLLYLRNGHNICLLQQIADPLQTMAVAAQPAPGTSCFPAGKGKACARFRLLCFVKNTDTKIVNANWLPVVIILQDCPTHRTDAYVQAKGIVNLRHTRALLSG